MKKFIAITVMTAIFAAVEIPIIYIAQHATYSVAFGIWLWIGITIQALITGEILTREARK